MSETKIFSDLAVGNGWSQHKEIDLYFTKDLGPRFAQIIPQIYRTPRGLSVRLDVFCMCPSFQEDAEFIGGDYSNWAFLERRHPTTILKMPSFQEDIVLEGLLQVESWVLSVDRTEVLEKLSGFPPSLLIGYALRHITALAILGRRKKIESYLDNYRRGVDVGFCAGIGEEVLLRALQLCSRHADTDASST